MPYNSADYVICDIAGEIIGDQETRLDFAIDRAKAKLEDDPELRELTVWEIHLSGNLVTHKRTITFGPDADWQSVVVVLKPGEHVRAPRPTPRQIVEEDLEAYEPGDPKRITLEQRLGEWY